MELMDYFDHTDGTGILSTAHEDGRVDAAIYSRPHVFDDGTVALIMNEKRSHAFVSTNPKAHYLFIEDGPGYDGVRLALTKLREEENTELLYDLCRRCKPDPLDPGKVRYLVFFSVDEVRPLVGNAFNG